MRFCITVATKNNCFRNKKGSNESEGEKTEVIYQTQEGVFHHISILQTTNWPLGIKY